jgi:hypothetical protein
MIKISDAITKYELTEIIRTLVSFIIVDGKKFVNENDKKEYISKYLFTLSTAMNGIPSFVDMNKVARIIEEDISKHHLGDGQNAEKLTKSE